MGAAKKKIIACAAVLEEMLPVLPPEVTYSALDMGLHSRPENLKRALQKAIDQSALEADVLILGYGLCSKGAVGLRAPETATLIIPRVHDCIAILLGSHESYLQEMIKEKGTYFLSKGFVEAGGTPLDEYRQSVERFGRKAADRIMKAMFCHYKRLLFINTGHEEIARYTDHAKAAARQLGLIYQEAKGSRALMTKMVHGPWDEEFILIEPGKTIKLDRFLR
jgi:hypothetical protein